VAAWKSHVEGDDDAGSCALLKNALAHLRRDGDMTAWATLQRDIAFHDKISLVAG
jgi:hypothetical protein